MVKSVRVAYLGEWRGGRRLVDLVEVHEPREVPSSFRVADRIEVGLDRFAAEGSLDVEYVELLTARGSIKDLDLRVWCHVIYPTDLGGEVLGTFGLRLAEGRVAVSGEKFHLVLAAGHLSAVLGDVFGVYVRAVPFGMVSRLPEVPEPSPRPVRASKRSGAVCQVVKTKLRHSPRMRSELGWEW